MSLKIEILERGGDLYQVNLDGRLETATYPYCESHLLPVLDKKPKVLMFDMEKLSYISSMGLRVIFKARKRVESTGGSLVMVNLQPQIAKIFDIANALPKESIFASVEEADQYFDIMQRKELDRQKKL